MGIFTEAVAEVGALLRESNVTNWSGVSQYISGRAGFPDGKYETFAREGYMTNALVYACIEELATSSAEPVMQVMQAGKWLHRDDGGSSSAMRLLDLFYGPKERGDGTLTFGVNPWMDDFEFWRTVILHLSIAGNAYALKVRSRSGAVRQLWLMRPDRMRIVPDAQNFIRRYEYNMGDRDPIQIPVEDVIQWKKPNPLNDHFGMPPLMPLSGVVDLDNYAVKFVKTYFQKAGVPSAILATKQKITPDLAKEIRDRFSNNFGGDGQWLGLLVLDQTEATYTPMTQALGAQGLVLPELNYILEARICGAFGVPPELVGSVVGTQSSSYANKRASREGFWNETLKPLYRELVGPLNRGLVPEFAGVQRMAFDLSTVGALLPDQDALWMRVGNALGKGLVGHKESRRLVGLPEDTADDVFFIPSNLTQTPVDDIGAEPPALPPPAAAVPSGDGA